MSATSSTVFGFAKTDAARPCGERRKGLRLNSQVMQISRGLFPVKTSQHLSEITGYSVRSCEYWLSEKSVLPADALASLIQSDWGREFLSCVMTDTTPLWWLKIKALIKRTDIDALRAREDRHYRELLNEKAEAARAYPTAPEFQDDDFYNGLAKPDRAIVPRRRR
jgi:hypothetical protein